MKLKKCIAITRAGIQCGNRQVVGGYCVTHWRIYLKAKSKEKKK